MDTTSNNIAGGWFTVLRPVRDPESAGRPALAAVIERVRRRWRLRLLGEGLLWTLVLGLAVFLAAAWLINELHFEANALWLLRAATALSLLALIAGFCLRPLRRVAGDLRVALYLEEHEPELKSILLAAVDARRTKDPDLSAQLVEQLEARALEACARIEFGDRVERAALRRAGTRLGLVLLGTLGLALWPPAFLQSGAPALLQTWASASEVSPYRIELTPGDAEIARGADQKISVAIDGYDGDGVALFTSTDGGDSWRETEMTAAAPGRYHGFLFDIAANTDYYVAGAGRETRVYRLAVTEIPAVESIGLRYHYPAYTMLPPEDVDDSGDIAALRGTRVEVTVTPTIDIPGGALQFGDGSRIELQRADAGAWVGEITVADDDTYQVILQRASGLPVETLPEYRITALADQYPRVSIISPGRDTKVSMIEEPVLRVRASDDQGIATLELILSINGEDERRIELMPAEPGAAQQVEAEHVVYLEDLGLRPGDLISYYVSAGERAPEETRRTATSDIFFYQVRPFSNSYRRAQQQGGGGGGGGGGGQQQQGQLSEQQKQFVVATFKMIRDRASFSDETWRDNLDLLVTAQSRIRDRVEAIVRRLERRSIVHTDERYRVILDELPQAVEAMRAVEARLGEAAIEPALTDAQVALKHLQRADAEFRDINVALGNQGGGGGAQNAEDLANLFQLEMDKLRHQYDTVQRGAQRQQPAPNEVIDEALEKLRELARRQQQEVERMLRRQGQAQSGGASREQLALAEQLEEMARRLERLSREQPNRELRQSARQMREAAEAMRRAAAEAENGGSGSGGVEQARQAAENLREARRLLDQGRVRQFSEQVERSLRRAELAERKQAEIRREVSGFDTGRDQRFEERLERLEQKKQSLSDTLTELEGELGELVTHAKEEQPKAGESLRQAIRSAHDNRLQDRIGRTRQMLRQNNRALATDNEAEIRRGIAQLREQIETALASVEEGSGRDVERQLEELRDLAREMRSIRDRRARAEANPGGVNGEANRSEASAESNRGETSGEQSQAAAGGNPNRGTTQGNANYRGAAGGSNFFDGHGGGIIQPRELENIVKRARRVTENLVEENRLQPGDIDPLLANLEALAQDPLSASPAAHDLALQALMELEYRLRTEQEAPDQPDPLIAEPVDIPDEYRQMIADYFRNLSQE